MADNNKELIDFFSKQLQQINNKIDQTNANLENKIANLDNKIDQTSTNLENKISQFNANLEEKIVSAKEEAMRHTGVLIEEVNHKIDLLVEGMSAMRERKEMDKEEHEDEHGKLEKRILINTADISTLDQRVGRLEGKI
ncbi:MAG: hypothetical protein ACYDFU_00375 [Nitrospirota bacterium]